MEISALVDLTRLFELCWFVFPRRLNAFEKTMRACDVKFRDLALKAREEVCVLQAG